MRNVPRHIIVLAFSAILISLLYAFYWHDRPRVDAVAYDKIGWNLAQGLGYVEDARNATTPELDWAPIRVGPGYQFFLAAVYSLFGHTIWVVWVLQAVLRGASVILLWLISVRLFPTFPRVALTAALLFAFAPDLIVVSGLLLTETFFIFIFLASLYASLVFLEQRHGGALVAAALLWPYAILTRPTALLTFGFFLLFLCWKKNWRSALFVVVAAACIIGPWSYKMSQRYDRFILTTSVGSYDLWVGNHAGAKGGFEKSLEIQQVRDSVSMLELDRISREKYWQFVLESPGAFTLLQIKKASLYFSLIRPTGFWIHLSDYPLQRLVTLIASGVWTAALFVFGVAGFVMVLPRMIRETKLALLGAAVLLQPLAVIPVIVESRYRFVLYPLLALFAAFWLSQQKGKNRGRALMIALVFLGTATFLDIIFHSGTIIRRLQDALALW